VIACLSIPAFALRAPLLRRPELAGRPVALAPVPGEQPLLGSCTGAAERAGIRPGMRLSEALATCPQLELVEQDPAGVEEAWEIVLRRLEEAGFAVEPVEPGCVYFETRGVERLAGGLQQTLRRALDAVGPEWGARVGAASRRFAALAAATVAPAGRALVIDDGDTRLFLEPLPLDLLPLTPERREELSELGVKRLGELARLPGTAVADRLGRPSSPRRSRFRSRWRTSSRSRGPWRCSWSACSPARSGAAGPRGSLPSRRSSSAAAPGGARSRCASRRRSPTAFGSRSLLGSRSCRRPRRSSGWSWES
jgi:protein ImuB